MADVLDEKKVDEKEDGRAPRDAEGMSAGAAVDAETHDAAIDLEGARAEAEFDEARDEPVAPARRRRPLYKRPLFLIVAAIVLVVAALVGLRYWLYARSHETTDDAFVDGRVVQLSPKVTGYVAKVYVADNQPVKEGDLIAELDARDRKSTRLNS